MLMKCLLGYCHCVVIFVLFFTKLGCESVRFAILSGYADWHDTNLGPQTMRPDTRRCAGLSAVGHAGPVYWPYVVRYVTEN